MPGVVHDDQFEQRRWKARDKGDGIADGVSGTAESSGGNCIFSARNETRDWDFNNRRAIAAASIETAFALTV